MRLSQIWVYPVKSLAGFSADSWSLSGRGLVDDRRWMLVDGSGHFLSQRALPSMSQLQAFLPSDGLGIRDRSGAEWILEGVQARTGRECIVQIWDDQVAAVQIEAPGLTDWLRTRLGHAVELVYMPNPSRRPVDPVYAKAGELVSFADGFPYLIANETSIADLSTRCGEPVDMLRFRPNLVISGGSAWEEDQWSAVRIGAQEFLTPKPCARCGMVNVDPQSGAQGKELLQALAAFRKFGHKVIFGMNACWRDTGMGRVGVGDEVQVFYK